MAKQPKSDTPRGVTTKGLTNITLHTLAERINLDMGERTAVQGNQLISDPPRLPTGIFAIDFATGGGFPIWATSCLWGPDSGGKSNLALNAASMASLLCWRCFKLLEECSCSAKALEMQTAWLDVEGTLDRIWAQCIGVDPDKLLLVLAETGEQYANIAESVLRADDCGLVVIDSLAALVPSDEMDAAAEDQFYAAQTRLITRMVRKLKQRLIIERKHDHPCLVLMTNQMRTKIGLRFGDPETMSGGWAMRHEFSLLLRCMQKSMAKDGPDKKYFDEKRGKRMGQRFAHAIRKAKVQTLAGLAEYVRMIEDMSAFRLHKGQVDDLNTLMNYAKQYGIVSKGTSGRYKYFERSAAKLEDIKEVWRRHRGQRLKTQQEIVVRAKARLVGGEAIHEAPDDEDSEEG